MSDPLVRHLKRVRETHAKSQARVEDCMGLPQGSYRHIERGRRPLPDLRHELVNWLLTFEDCVGATKEERQTILSELSRTILDQFAALLQDIEQSSDHTS